MQDKDTVFLARLYTLEGFPLWLCGRGAVHKQAEGIVGSGMG
jgi:hypothetical protein